MKNLVKVSRESLKSLKGSGGPACPDDPAFGMCYPPGWPNGICMTKYQCCMKLGGPIEFCKEEYGK
ncbi:hypothetical protein J2795_003872 [Chryseobacterium bernardetii]|jgi:hypothetical protein|uniref:Uncharacterized protein n=2 Tax=Chryseobacterium TaxID=59732 RepID=A0A543E923_9FLAO|nr:MULTISPECIES: hypothetical protein [Chryseobacterium]MDR6371650.1 hypothetical protein [Chryseobacterium vietnamense]MDR6443138.1 hypothetical protein [Chryseobacterium bernardetii]MDR6488703.1 hypothetical protein [Chryseobacterium vietnamense]TQM18068.1 hypothetical protein FB551_3830 [Chryseobacterium aquifrigidense]